MVTRLLQWAGKSRKNYKFSETEYKHNVQNSMAIVVSNLKASLPALSVTSKAFSKATLMGSVNQSRSDK